MNTELRQINEAPNRATDRARSAPKTKMKRIMLIVGARPNFPKIAPIHRELLARGRMRPEIIHTGQHYDERMSDVFFSQLGMPAPDVFLGTGGGSHAEQTARVMVAFETCVAERKPDFVLVVGDVNSTVACAMVAAKEQIPLVHVEAGLRSWDRGMPEEINRLVVDRLSDLLFTSEPSGRLNLLAEGTPSNQIHFSGNVMIDSLISFCAKARETTVIEDLGVKGTRFALVTLHRPSNVDRMEGAREIDALLRRLAARMSVVFPVHPRTLGQLKTFGLWDGLTRVRGLQLVAQQGYLEFLSLMENAAVVVTDSGGIQEETTFLRVPCLTLRGNTERPVTVDLGTNELMPLDADRVDARVAEILAGKVKTGQIPPLWDGCAAGRIADILEGI